MDVYVDCWDRRTTNYPTIKVSAGNDAYIFVFDPTLKRTVPFQFGIFADELALSNAPFRYPRERRLAILQETPIKGLSEKIRGRERTFAAILTFEQALLDQGKPYHELLYGTSWINRGRPDALARYDKDTFVSFIGSIQHEADHGYAFRKAVAQYCVRHPDIQAWGRGIREFRFKDDVIASCYFSIAMENCRHDHYFTEKIIDCFVTETVPIYWGCRAISTFFNPDGILTFNDIDELEQILPSLTAETYHSMRAAIAENKRTAFALKLTGHETMYERIALFLNALNLEPTMSFSTTKIAAFARKQREI